MSEMKVKLLSHTKDPEKIIASAAKLCYSSSNVEELMNNLTEESIDKFVSMLSNLGHESPFEHVSFTFAIEGVSRSLTHQLVRHRIASFSQKSQRYVTEGQFEYVIPPEIELCIEARTAFIKSMEDAQEAYNNIFDALRENHMYRELQKIDDEYAIRYLTKSYLNHNEKSIPIDVLQKVNNIAEKKAAEDARYALPNACESSIIVTMNVRSLWNFFKHRCCNRAQWEIRDMAKTMLTEVRKVSPVLFKNAGAACVQGLGCPENSMQCSELKGKILTQKEVKELIINSRKP